VNTVDYLRMFKKRLFTAIETKTSWGKNELSDEITRIYMEILEEIINPNDATN
jgi:hypothetical protein